MSIAALKLGAASALAVDIDDKCLDVAYENAALNGIGKDTYTVKVGDILSDQALRSQIGGYQVVLANIVADVIIALAPFVPSLLAPGGVFLCSGSSMTGQKRWPPGPAAGRVDHHPDPQRRRLVRLHLPVTANEHRKFFHIRL